MKARFTAGWTNVPRYYSFGYFPKDQPWWRWALWIGLEKKPLFSWYIFGGDRGSWRLTVAWVVVSYHWEKMRAET